MAAKKKASAKKKKPTSEMQHMIDTAIRQQKIADEVDREVALVRERLRRQHDRLARIRDDVKARNIQPQAGRVTPED